MQFEQTQSKPAKQRLSGEASTYTQITYLPNKNNGLLCIYHVL